MASPSPTRAQSSSRENMPPGILNTLDEIRNSISALVIYQTKTAENNAILSKENEKSLKEGQEILTRLGIKGDIQTDIEGIELRKKKQQKDYELRTKLLEGIDNKKNFNTTFDQKEYQLKT